MPNASREIASVLKRVTGKSRDWTKEEIRSVIYSLRGQRAGTWAHENIALGYAAYLSADLAVEIRDVFLRYRRGDESLVDDIRSRRPANDDRDLHRQIGKGVRNCYTATLDGHGVTMPVEYAQCTNAAYKELFGGTAKQLRQQRGLPPKASIRDDMTIAELAFTMASEALATERIEQQNAQGFLECHDATRQASSAIRGAIEADRKNRLPKAS